MTGGDPPDPGGPGNLPSGREGPHVFVEDLEGPEMTDADAHHIARVLRVRTGDRLTICDGQGRWRTAVLGPEHLIEVTGPVVTVGAPAQRLTIGFALVKGERPEMVVQKATELGIDRIVPFVADRSVVRWDAHRAARNLSRLEGVAREAAMQSRRCWLPVLEPVQPFAELDVLGEAALAERFGPPLGAATATVLVGPEGGWSESERARVADRVGLGVNVLRAETAAVAAATLLVAQRDAWRAPRSRRVELPGLPTERGEQ